MNYAQTLGEKAKKAAPFLAAAQPNQKNQALYSIAKALIDHKEEILAANAEDLKAAQEANMTKSLQDRLRLTEARIQGMADAVKELAVMDDPIGIIESGSVRPNGLQIMKTRVPLGVIGIIFESRPNVTVDAATLCLKAGNAVILRGGKEAIHSNTCLANVMRSAVVETGIPEDSIQLVEDISRQTATDMMRLNGYLDVL
ncbi:MAG: aldehyde dehydrogenase family protein, partial [Ruminococcus sp.]|nr:aldehyde dehydrogenase family protein [Ruminococcus sp.]